MSNTNRHTPPTAEQLANRIYRRVLEVKEGVAGVQAQAMAMAALLEEITASTQLMETLAVHVKRLLLEKETLMRVIGANDYMAAALPRRPIPMLTEEAKTA